MKFSGQLRRGVRRQDLRDLSLVLGHRPLIAIRAARTGVDHATDAILTAGVEQIDRPRGAGGMSLERCLDAARNRCERGLVKDDFHTLHRPRHRVQVAEVGLHEVHSPFEVREVAKRPCRKVVQHADNMPVLDQPRGKVRPNKSCAACYQIRCHVVCP